MGLFGPSKKEIALQQEVDRLKELLTPEHREIENLQKEIDNLNVKKNGLSDSIFNLEKKIGTLTEQSSNIEKNIKLAQKELVGYHLDIEMQEYGIYKPHYDFANSSLYKDALTDVRNRQKECIKKDQACNGNYGWTVNGSATKGKTMVKDTQKLLLRAFNVECDDIVENIKVTNYDSSVERIYKISEQISKLGKIMDISITNKYIKLKIEELELALDFRQKKQEEKDALRELKQQQREEAKLQKEIEAERKKLYKEQTHYQNALTALLAQIEKNGETQELLDKKTQLEASLNDTEAAIKNVDYREANKRAGYVYVISNIGAFGDDVYKIGMTRRLDPMERIDELGDASVPFDYDVHALIFSDDAPALESALHNAFEANKVNKINSRREFFKISLNEIKAVVAKNFDKTVEWIDVPEAEQYRLSIARSKNKHEV